MHRIPVVFIAVCSLGISQSALALRCDNNLISKGDHLIEVLEKCGDPVHADKWLDDRVVSVHTRNHRKSYTPNRYTPHSYTSNRYKSRHQKNRQREVIRYRHTPYGVTALSTNLHVRSPYPTYLIETETNKRGKRSRIVRTESVSVDLWTYNFGARRFMRQLRFENGILKDIKSLRYGYR